MILNKKFIFLVSGFAFFFFYMVAALLIPYHTSAATNLISNPGFESPSAIPPNDPQGWIRGRWGANTATFTYPAVGPDGSKSAKVTMLARTTGDAKWAFASIPILEEHTYEYSNTYTSNVRTYVTLEYKMADGTSLYPDIAAPEPSTTWKNSTVRFTAPKNARSVTVYHLLNTVGTLNIDNVSLTDVTATTGNIIPNDSLESVGLDDEPLSWNKGKWGTNIAHFSFPIAGYEGSNAAEINMTSRTSGDAKWYFEDVHVTPGQSYEFVNYYKASVPTYVTVQFKKNDGNISYLDLGNPAASATWKEFRRTFTVPPGVMSLTVFHVIKSVGTLHIDKYSLIRTTAPADPTKLDKGYVSINFDDGWLSSYENALPLLTSYGFVSDQFMVTGRIGGGFPAYMTSAQVYDAQTKGVKVGSHTVNHVDLTTLSTIEAQQEIHGSRQDLISIGINPVNIFSYPYGGYNSSIQQLVRNSGYIAARSSDGGYNDKTTDIYALKRQPMTNATTFTHIKNYIDTALSNKTWVILLFHEIDYSGNAYAVTPELFDQTLTYLKQQNVTPISIEKGVSLITQ